MISCVLLASADPGRPLTTSLEQIVRDLHGAQLFDISLVGGGDDLGDAVRQLPLTVVAPSGSTDLLDLVAGLDALPRGEISGVLVWSLDAGARSVGFLVNLFHEFYKSRGRIVVADDAEGPVIIDASLFDELRGAGPRATLRLFLDDHAADLRRISPVHHG